MSAQSCSANPLTERSSIWQLVNIPPICWATTNEWCVVQRTCVLWCVVQKNKQLASFKSDFSKATFKKYITHNSSSKWTWFENFGSLMEHLWRHTGDCYTLCVTQQWTTLLSFTSACNWFQRTVSAKDDRPGKHSACTRLDSDSLYRTRDRNPRSVRAAPSCGARSAPGMTSFPGSVQCVERSVAPTGGRRQLLQQRRKDLRRRRMLCEEEVVVWELHQRQSVAGVVLNMSVVYNFICEKISD